MHFGELSPTDFKIVVRKLNFLSKSHCSLCFHSILCCMLCAIEFTQVMSTQPCPQQPYSAPVDACLRLLLSWSPSISYLLFLFSCCLLVFPAVLSFPKSPAFSWWTRSRTAQFCHFGPQLNLLLFIFLVVQGIRRALLQHHISNKSIFFPISLRHCPTCTFVHSDW